MTTDTPSPYPASKAPMGAKNILLTLVFIVLGVLLVFGGLSPCGMLRENIRAQLSHSGGIAASLLPVMPDTTFTRLTTLSPDALSATQCFKLDVTGDSGLGTTPAQTGLPAPEVMIRIGQTMATAIQECREKRINDELKTHVASVQCSNARITDAYAKAGYPYMDIVGMFTAKRLELAAQLDTDNITETDEQHQMEDIMVKMVNLERQRQAKQP